MATRAELHTVLCDILGSTNVYFQPPPTVKMKYPCIVYGRSNDDTTFADNYPYRHVRRYWITVIDPNPDTVIPDKVAMLQLCLSDRIYTADNLNHYRYNLYF